ncbi:cyclic AMP-dependent transcription factor ATF-4-like [Callorhinchus milii]|uniref:Cyclic AMP-dependent transcription factor ATF-4 n=1 Tax=Callorhinchus milii TaxID=7868 RepID=K4GEY3_CALMI|nr:cyclic AMP-dependent transcription factor ATF-4-like [Callorhinchus milii]AFM90980.1 activating transcription factor 4 isoform 1 [Callorhinchus milii]
MSVWPNSSLSTLMEDLVSLLDSPFLTAEDDPCLLHKDLEAGPVKACLRSLPFGDASSQWPCVNPLLDTDNGVGDAFTGLDWMVEKVDLFDTLIEDESDPPSPEDLMAALDRSCDLLDDLPFDPLPNKLQVSDPVLDNNNLDFGAFPTSPLGSDQLAPASPSPVSLKTPELFSSPSHSINYEEESETSVLDNDKRLDLALLQSSPLQNSCKEKDEGALSDSDSGLCKSPVQTLDSGLDTSLARTSGGALSDSDSGLPASPCHSPVQSPDNSMSEGSSQSGLSSLESLSPVRSTPYDRPNAETVAKVTPAKVKVISGAEPKVIEKKLKKMEQNKSAATRYRQKKRAEQEAITAECRQLEAKNQTLQEKVDSMAKEIQYLKGLVDEVRKAKIKKEKSL